MDTESNSFEVLIPTAGWEIVRRLPDGELWARHRDTGRLMDLEYLPPSFDGDPAEAEQCNWSGDLQELPDLHPDVGFYEYWASAYVAEDLRRLLDAGRLRVYGATHGLPGADPLGALVC